MRATQAPLGPAVATLSGAAEVEDISWKARQNLTQCVSHRNNSCGRRNTVICHEVVQSYMQHGDRND